MSYSKESYNLWLLMLLLLIHCKYGLFVSITLYRLVSFGSVIMTKLINVGLRPNIKTTTSWESFMPYSIKYLVLTLRCYFEFISNFTSRILILIDETLRTNNPLQHIFMEDVWQIFEGERSVDDSCLQFGKCKITNKHFRTLLCF